MIVIESNVYPEMKHTPLWQAQEQILLRTLSEARNAKPADGALAILILASLADTESILDDFATSRCGRGLGGRSETADELHLSERARGAGGESANGARHLLADGLHCDGLKW